MSRRTLATRLVLWALVLLLLPIPDAKAVDIVGQTTATLSWTAASGPVAGYGVFISRDGGASFPGTASSTTTTTTATISATVGQSVVVKVAAYDAAGTYGPMSPASDVMNFVSGTPAAAIALSASSTTVSVLAGASPSATSFTVRNSGGGTLSYSISDNQSWLGVSPSSGTSTGESDTITLSYSTGTLAAGSYTATVTVSATGLTSQTHTVNLTVTAPPAAITLSASTLTASAVQGANPAAQSFTVRNSGGGTLSYSISDDQSWLSLSPTSGTSTGETDTIAVNFAASALSAGSYSATITVAGGSGVTSKTISVSLTISAPAAAITLSASTLTASAVQGANPAAQSFTVRNSGGGTLSYSISDDQSWLSLSPTSGTSTGETDTIAVNFSASALSAGSYSATITVAGGSGVTSKTIAVSLTISAPPAVITLSTAAITASAAQGSSPAAQSFTVRNSGGGTLSYSISDDQSWLSLSPTSGTSTGETDTIAVSFATTGLSAGTHAATITVAGGSGVSSQTLAVTLTISAATTPVISLSKTTIAVTTRPGTSPAGQTFTVRNVGVGTLSWTATDNQSWMSVTPASGTTTTETDSLTVVFPSNSLGVGTYTGTVTISGGASVAPATLTVVLTITNSPVIALGTSLLSPQTSQGTNAANQSFTVRNTGGGTLSWSLSDDAAWLSTSPASGTGNGENDTVTVSYATTGLAVGTHTATITASGGDGVAPQVVTVSLTITTPPILTSSASAITASSTPGVSPASQSLTVQNTGAGTMNWTLSESISWLSITPYTGSSTGEADTATINFATTSLAAGTYNGTITLTATGAVNSPMTIPVTLTVGATASLSVSTTSIAVSGVHNVIPGPSLFTVKNGGAGSLDYSVSSNQPWLQASPASGTSTGELDSIGLSYNTIGYPAGTYVGTVTVSAAGVSNAPQTVTVTMTVRAATVSDLDFSSSGAPAYDVQYADVTGDGHPDLLIGDDHSRFWVAPWSASGFGTPTVWLVHGGGLPSKQMQYHDVNGDGRADAIFFVAGAGSVYVSLAQTGSFAAPALWAQFPSSSPDQVHYPDVNGDGRADVAWFDTSTTPGYVHVGVSTGTGFTTPTMWAGHGGAVAAAKLQFGDANGDGMDDLLYFDSGGNSLVWVNLSVGTGYSPPTAWLQHGPTPPQAMKYADVNGDGAVDALLFAATFSDIVYASPSTGTSFTPAANWLEFAYSTVDMLQYADVNGDGLADALYFDLLRGGAVQVGTSLGLDFATPATWTTITAPVTSGDDVAWTDFDGDGRADMAVHRSDNKIELRRSTGSALTAATIWPAP